MKVEELQRVAEDKVGRVIKRNVTVEPHEDSTMLYLAQFGFSMEAVKPANTHKTRSADVLISGAIWEIKSPTTFNKSTIKEDFRKAASQSDRVIFDLRRVKKYANDVEEQIIKLFKGKGRVRRLMIIEKGGKILDFTK